MLHKLVILRLVVKFIFAIDFYFESLLIFSKYSFFEFLSVFFCFFSFSFFFFCNYDFLFFKNFLNKKFLYLNLNNTNFLFSKFVKNKVSCNQDRYVLFNWVSNYQYFVHLFLGYLTKNGFLSKAKTIFFKFSYCLESLLHFNICFVLFCIFENVVIPFNTEQMQKKVKFYIYSKKQAMNSMLRNFLNKLRSNNSSTVKFYKLLFYEFQSLCNFNFKSETSIILKQRKNLCKIFIDNKGLKKLSQEIVFEETDEDNNETNCIFNFEVYRNFKDFNFVFSI